MHLTGEGVRVDGPKGPVLIRLSGKDLAAEYRGSELRNGSALAYAREIRALAIAEARRFPLPWTTDAQGRQRITDPKAFYAQTFDPSLRGLEALRGRLEREP